MPLDRERLLQWRFPDLIQRYSARDAIIYALSIGVPDDPLDLQHLQFVTEENLVAFPTLALVLGARDGVWMEDAATGITRRGVVHGEEHAVFHDLLPPHGTIRAETAIVDVLDKGEGRGALVVLRRNVLDQGSGRLLATITSTIFCREDGGFAASISPAPALSTNRPMGPSELELETSTAKTAALLYRLNGDWNPLHAYPARARAAGFSEPPLHGLCTMGMAAHCLLRACRDYSPDALAEIAVRFSGPFFPGETLVVRIWLNGAEMFFEGWAKERNAKVLDRGKAVVRRSPVLRR